MYWTTSQFMLRQPEAETRLTCCCYCTDCSPLWAETSVCFDKFSFIYTATNHQEEKWEPRTSACSQNKEPSKCISFTEYDTCLQVNRQEVVSWLEPVIWTLTTRGQVKIKASVDYQHSVSPRPRVSLHPLEADSLLSGWLPDCEDWRGNHWHRQHEAKCQEQCKHSSAALCFDSIWSPFCARCLCVTWPAVSAEGPGLHHRRGLQGPAMWDVKDVGVQDALEAFPSVPVFVISRGQIYSLGVWAIVWRSPAATF